MSSIPGAEYPLEPLKNVFVHLERCTIRLPLTFQQWCTVLSGLKDAKNLKELGVHMLHVYYVMVSATDMNSKVTMMCFHIRAATSEVLTLIHLMP